MMILPGQQMPKMYPCPNCRNVTAVEKESTVKNHTKQSIVGASLLLLLAGLGLILFSQKTADPYIEQVGVYSAGLGVLAALIGLALPRRHATGTSRECISCGHRWLV